MHQKTGVRVNGRMNMMDNNQNKYQPLSRLEESVLRVFLWVQVNDLHTSAGNDNTPVTFIVEAGRNVEQIAEELFAKGLIKDTEVFQKYVRFNELDSRLRVGRYELNATMTIPEIVDTIMDTDSVVLKAIIQ